MEVFAMTLICLGFFASIFFGWYYYLQARNKERMALIEKNADVSEIFKGREIRFRFPWLKFGLLITGVGFGFCLAITLIPYFLFLNFSGGKESMALGSILFFGGLGIVTAYFIDKPKNH